MPKKKSYEPILFSQRKADIFERHNQVRASGIPASDIVFAITKKVDPDLTKTIEFQRKKMREREKRKK